MMKQHAFVSYVRENRSQVDALCRDLEKHGITVWLDRNNIRPGTRWKEAVRTAISQGAFFLACFSDQAVRKRRSYMNEELTLAIDELRLRPADRAWFVPIRLDGCELPRRPISSGETLADIQWVDLSVDWSGNIRRLVDVLLPPDHGPSRVDDRTAVAAARTRDDSHEVAFGEAISVADGDREPIVAFDVHADGLMVLVRSDCASVLASDLRTTKARVEPVTGHFRVARFSTRGDKIALSQTGSSVSVLDVDTSGQTTITREYSAEFAEEMRKMVHVPGALGSLAEAFEYGDLHWNSDDTLIGVGRHLSRAMVERLGSWRPFDGLESVDVFDRAGQLLCARDVGSALRLFWSHRGALLIALNEVGGLTAWGSAGAFESYSTHVEGSPHDAAYYPSHDWIAVAASHMRTYLVEGPDGPAKHEQRCSYSLGIYSGRSGSKVVREEFEAPSWLTGAVSIAFHPAGKIMASAHADGMIRLWSTSECSLLCETIVSVDAPRARVRQLAFGPSGRELYYLVEGNTGAVNGLTVVLRH